MKLKQFLTTGNEGGDINILSDGGDIQSPMPHGNWNMYFQMMATCIAATLLTHCTAIVLTHSIAILIALPLWYSIYSGQFCRLFSS